MECVPMFLCRARPLVGGSVTGRSGRVEKNHIKKKRILNEHSVLVYAAWFKTVFYL